MNKIKLESDLIIITNTSCNMSCSNCILLPHHNNGESFKWSNVNDRMEAWANYLDVDTIAIAGGEMFLHPNLDEWFINLRRLWPTAYIEVPTNGTLLTDRLELSRLICSDLNAQLRVSCLHKEESKCLAIKEKILKVLEPWIKNIIIKEYNGSIFYYLNDKAILRYDSIINFIQPYYQKTENNTVHFLMNGDQEHSFNACPWHSSYIIQQGLLHHCPATVNYTTANVHLKFLPEVQESFNKYKPYDPLIGYDYIKDYIENGKKSSIEACQHCAYDKQEPSKIFNAELEQLP